MTDLIMCTLCTKQVAHVVSRACIIRSYKRTIILNFYSVIGVTINASKSV